MPVLTTTPVMIYGPVKNRSFVLDAPPGNVGNIIVSSKDPNCKSSFVTLAPGQQQAFVNWTGSLYAYAVTGGDAIYPELDDGAPQQTGAALKGV